jgi:hypothetical protein
MAPQQSGAPPQAPVHDDIALPPLALTDVVEHRDAARALHDTAEVADTAAKLRQPGIKQGRAGVPFSGPAWQFTSWALSIGNEAGTGMRSVTKRLAA